MRARIQQQSGMGPLWVAALAMGLAVFGLTPAAMAQGDAEQEAASESPAVAVPPAPPVAPKAPGLEVDKQVKILRQEDGSLRILTRGSDGENGDIEVNLGKEFGGEVSRRIVEKLEAKGILDEKGLVLEEALESVPRNVDIGISAEIAREHAERAREHAERTREHEVRVFGSHDHDSGELDLDWLVPVVAILAVFGTPILIVWLVTRNSYRKKQLLMDNINRLVAEGRDIPPELLDAMDGERTADTKDRGFTLIAVGAAVFIWLTAAGGLEAGSLGLIPLFIGVARYINWKLDNQSQQQAG
ncbi:DUF6249 domain-containing protein [Microbulbifer aggregans]|uniref:DUF6249 domain-containing protein n=1 Tax=Microbulbifer aggregans TaxID=1769779 RepID=UPI001CFC89B2|nr:DUF6249 domain-containing protein [Microbulbifer aggregans]